MDHPPSVDAVIEQIPPRLRRAREKKRLSLDDLARATGISTSTLSRLESAQRKPSLELLIPITTALGMIPNSNQPAILAASPGSTAASRHPRYLTATGQLTGNR